MAKELTLKERMFRLETEFGYLRKILYVVVVVVLGDAGAGLFL